jgi:hypothetical protein
MAPIEVMFTFLEAVGFVLAIVATMRIMRERDNFGRSAAQMAFVWLVPFVGPLVTIQLLRKEPERGSGTYSSEKSLLDDGDRIRQRDATFESGSDSHSSHGEGGHE